MLGNLLLAFFIGMPAIVMWITRGNMRLPATRAIMMWGAAAAIFLAAVVVTPLLACDGSMISHYTNCFGQGGPDTGIGRAQSLIILAGKIYVLVGIPMALLTFAADRFLTRNGTT